ncbi:apolipoprotein, partial [Mytilus galloprovincialis]
MNLLFTVCKRKCLVNERCRKGKCRCKKGSYRTKLGTCKTKTPCKSKCKSGFVCSFRGKCRPKACKRKCRINERCRKGKCRCKKGSYRTKLGTCKTKTPCKPKCKSGFVCSFRGKCRPKACKRKCRINERCRKGKCRCKKGSYRTKLGTCKTKTPCKRKCKRGFVCSFRGKCKPKGCKRKCRINERCVRGKCRCKKGSYRTKLGACRTKTPCKPKCQKGFVCNFLGKCRPKGCKRKCRINERCRKGQCRCKKGSFRTKLGTCKTKTACTPKCESGFVCSFLGNCRPKGCKRKCRINERCVRGKCRCKKDLYRTKLGVCRTKIQCTTNCKRGFVCSFLGKCRPKGCKRKCRINERCFKGKCRCNKDSFRTKLGTCKKRCNADSCGVNAVCVARKYCRCKRGYAGHPKTLCEEVKECLKNARGNDYNGRMSTTESGRTCQAWNKQTPHRHSKSNVRDAKNYCRNMDNEPRPWCYTTDSRKRAPKPPCGDMVIMACHSDREHRTECIVPNAERINYIELKSGEDNPSCTFGVTYGFYGVTIWTKENCREKIKVCLTPRNRVPILPPPEECRNTEKGKDYVGKWSKTETGKNCQRWDQQYPHTHAFFLDGKDSENYCRNFDGSSRPWCYTEDPYTEREYCAIHKCAPEDPEDVDECRKSAKGTEYKGRISLTQTGRTCQYWERQYPHKHPFSISFKTEHNYCRNPDNSGQPWCYTNDPTTRWEYCQIPMCGK